MKDFILKIPKWEGQIDFSWEVITLVIVMITLIVGVMMCFWGYRYFQTLVRILFGCICGMAGFGFGQIITSNTILQMYIFVMFICLGESLLYFLFVLWKNLLKKLKVQSFVQHSLHIIASVSGALIVGIVTYTQVFCNLTMVIGITAVLVIGGMWYGSRKINSIRVFYTYDDLYRMKPLTEEKIHA